MTASQSKDLWYLMRGTGMVSLILLSLTLIAGIAGVRRWSTQTWPRAVLTFLHRNLALLAVVFLAVHVLSAIVDPYVSIGWLAAIVPFSSHWKSVWVGAGAVAVDLMIALVVSSLMRSHLSYRLWRSVHWLAYACWPLAMLHGFASGTDSTTGWGRAVYVVAILAVIAATLWRLGHGSTTLPTDRGHSGGIAAGSRTPQTGMPRPKVRS